VASEVVACDSGFENYASAVGETLAIMSEVLIDASRAFGFIIKKEQCKHNKNFY